MLSAETSLVKRLQEHFRNNESLALDIPYNDNANGIATDMDDKYLQVFTAFWKVSADVPLELFTLSIRKYFAEDGTMIINKATMHGVEEIARKMYPILRHVTPEVTFGKYVYT